MSEFISIKNKFTVILILAIAGVVIYYPSINGAFLNWDDEDYIVNNFLVKDFSMSGIQNMFLSFSMGNYHPLVLILYSFLYKLWPTDPFPFHLVNIILHVANSVLVYAIITRLSKNYVTGFILSLVFLCHPLHVESVAWISELKDVLYSFFFLLASYYYILYQGKATKRNYILVFFFYLLSLLSKGQAVVLPIVLILFDFIGGYQVSKKNVLEKVPFFLLSIFFGVIAIKAQSDAKAINVGAVALYTFYEKVILVCYGICINIYHFFLPLNLSAVYPYPFKPGESSYSLLLSVAPIIPLLLVSSLIYAFIKKQKWVLFGLSFFITTLFLVLQFIPVGEAVAADRYMYLPMLGLTCCLVPFISRFPDNLKKQIPVALIILSLATLSFQRSKIWKNKKEFWSAQKTRTPDYGKAWNNYGAVLLDEGDTIGAMEHLVNATKLNYRLAYISLAIVERKRGNTINALKLFKNAEKIYPKNVEILRGKAFCYRDLKQYNKALLEINKATELCYDNPHCLLNKADILYLNKKYEEAIEFYNLAENTSNYKSTSLYENRSKAKAEIKDYLGAISDLNNAINFSEKDRLYFKRAQLFFYLNKYEEAKNDLTKALALNPNLKNEMVNKGYAHFTDKSYNISMIYFEAIVNHFNADDASYNNLGLCYQKAKMYEKAIDSYGQSINLNRGNNDALYNRGRTFVLLKEYNKALNDFEQMLKNNPNHSASHKYKGVAHQQLNQTAEACEEYQLAKQNGFKGDLSMFEAACN